MEDCETAKEKCNYLAVFFVRIRPKLAFSLTLFALNYIFLHSVYFSSFPRRTKISLKRIYEFFLSPWWFHVIVWGFVWSGLSFSSLRQTNAAPPARNQLAAHIYKRRQSRKLKIYFYDNHRDSFSFSSAKRFHFIQVVFSKKTFLQLEPFHFRVEILQPCSRSSTKNCSLLLRLLKIEAGKVENNLNSARNERKLSCGMKRSRTHVYSDSTPHSMQERTMTIEIKKSDAEKSKLEVARHIKDAPTCRSSPSLCYFLSPSPRIFTTLLHRDDAARFPSIIFLSSPRKTNGRKTSLRVDWTRSVLLVSFFIECQNLFDGCFMLKWISATNV